MKLNLSQIASVTQGAVKISENDGSFHFFRFNDLEYKHYSKTEFYSKSLTTAGIQMSFRTDGDSIYLKANTSMGSTRTYFSFDMFVDGKYFSCLKNFDESEIDEEYASKKFGLGEYEGIFSIGSGEKNVRIVFPWSVIPEIKEISVENATYIEPVSRSRKILMYGDSITHGYDSLHPSNAYSVRLAHELDAEIYNKAIGGEIHVPALAEIKNSFTPDLITVAYGTNDWNRITAESFRTNSRAFYEGLTKNYPDVRIFALSPIWRINYKEERAFGDFFDVARIINEISSDFDNITHIDCFDFVPHDPMLFADRRLHPNDAGFEYYYRNILSAVKAGI